jgi:hypothetical protein
MIDSASLSTFKPRQHVLFELQQELYIKKRQHNCNLTAKQWAHEAPAQLQLNSDNARLSSILEQRALIMYFHRLTWEDFS